MGEKSAMLLYFSFFDFVAAPGNKNESPVQPVYPCIRTGIGKVSDDFRGIGYELRYFGV